MAEPVTMIVAARAVQVLASVLKGQMAEAYSAKLRSWFHDRLSGRAKEALNDLEALPSEDNLADLRKQLTRQIEEEPRLRAELQDLLPIGNESGTVRAVGDAIRTGNVNIGGDAFRRD